MHQFLKINEDNSLSDHLLIKVENVFLGNILFIFIFLRCTKNSISLFLCICVCHSVLTIDKHLVITHTSTSYFTIDSILEYVLHSTNDEYTTQCYM